MAVVRRVAGSLGVDERQEQTNHGDQRRVQRLVALLAAGLLLAACSGDGQSTVSPPVAPDRTATTTATTVPAAPTVPTTAPPRSPPAPTAAPDRLAAQLTTAET